MSTQVPALRCSIHPLNTLAPYKYVVVCACYRGQWLLSRHRERDTWETQGGHIEPGETPMDAARRELYEESGAVDYEIAALCDYRAWDENTGRGATGMVFTAEIRRLGDMPESEMAEVRLFDELPENLTYPAITPTLFAYMAEQKEKME